MRLIFYPIAALLAFTKPLTAQQTDPYKPDTLAPKAISGYTLAWHDEFNVNGKPDTTYWRYENGFVRNEELQWYQRDNATCKNGVLIIEGRREHFKNPNYKEGSNSWRQNREYVYYTSASINSRGMKQCKFGRLEVRARIDTSMGSWPAIWTLGIQNRWPLNGEVDIMEFYRVRNIPTILANAAWGNNGQGQPIWNTKRLPLAHFFAKDKNWDKKFHTWRMDWSPEAIRLYLDDELLNTADLTSTQNPDGSNPFLQPHYVLLNLALGANGGDPSDTKFPLLYEVDYVRYYEKK